MDKDIGKSLATAVGLSKEPPPKSDCVHYWLIGGPPLQLGICKKCGIEHIFGKKE